MTFEEAARQAALEFAELCITKQRDYGHRNILDFGEYGILVRLNDKVQRLINLYKQGKSPDNESVDDTWDDIGGYSLIRKMLRKGWFELPLEAVAKKELPEQYRVIRDARPLTEPEVGRYD